MPLVYSVWLRGNPASAAVDDGDGAVLVLGLPLDDDELVQALAVAKVRAATAAVPHRAVLVLAHLLLVAVVLRLTCSYLLVKESQADPGRPPRTAAGPSVMAVSLRIAGYSYTG